jgi:hypothetical protein
MCVHFSEKLKCAAKGDDNTHAKLVRFVHHFGDLFTRPISASDFEVRCDLDRNNPAQIVQHLDFQRLE